MSLNWCHLSVVAMVAAPVTEPPGPPSWRREHGRLRNFPWGSPFSLSGSLEYVREPGQYPHENDAAAREPGAGRFVRCSPLGVRSVGRRPDAGAIRKEIRTDRRPQGESPERERRD